ncbi:uncharacterized protein LOC114313879 [Camellia sinensis]|uniref:uncharacterized protein LOC114313879 n=1 Tax=Camellia sinensis TaxID=4442 RepID=UPI001035C7F9|nr:uncharacterized protein LOC114313879 [Camellia sinensis]
MTSAMRILLYGVTTDAVDGKTLQFKVCNIFVIQSHNDLNVLDRSPLFSNLAQDKAPPVHYTINGHSYNMGYYLADGIYPQWATLVQTISSSLGAKKQYFAMMQESARKDAERAFRVL